MDFIRIFAVSMKRMYLFLAAFTAWLLPVVGQEGRLVLVALAEGKAIGVVPKVVAQLVVLDRGHNQGSEKFR